MATNIRLEDINRGEFSGAGTVMVIGFFDGVHRGHQEIINLCIKKAAGTGGTSIALTFDHPPLNVLKKRLHKKLILTYEDKINLIGGLGIDVIVTAHIEKRFLDLSPLQFCDRILIATFDLKELFIGEGFRFGKGDSGDTGFLRTYLGGKNIKVNQVPLKKSRGEIISSTVIRKYYAAGNIKRIKQLLGRDPYLRGIVVKGAGRGKKLGIPTVNIDTGESLVMPADGVYVGAVSEEGPAQRMPALINIGDNPTFGDKKKRVESHILDYEGDMYRKGIKVEFLDMIREEIRFDSVESLIEQIKEDIRTGRAYFRKHAWKIK